MIVNRKSKLLHVMQSNTMWVQLHIIPMIGLKVTKKMKLLCFNKQLHPKWLKKIRQGNKLSTQIPYLEKILIYIPTTVKRFTTVKS